MCAFQGEKLKSDLKSEINQDFSALKAASFDATIDKLTNRYNPTQNKVLLHYQFHQLKQLLGEKIDSYINRVQLHADNCAFKCQNPGYTEKNLIHNSLIRDQIIIGTNMTMLRTNALDKEHDLPTLISQARTLETTCGTAKTSAIWVILDNTDLKGSRSNLLSCKLADSLGIISFHNPQHDIRRIRMQSQSFSPHGIYLFIYSQTSPKSSIPWNKRVLSNNITALLHGCPIHCSFPNLTGN